MTHWIDDLIDQQKPYCSLDQAFYRDSEIFEREVDAIVTRQWLFVDHISRIPNHGDYFLVEIAGESIIVIRDEKNGVAAFYNVCRHRGSQICMKKTGNRKRLMCPYHAWSFGLDGRLLAAPKMPEDFDKSEYPLHRCHVEVMEGLIFLNLSRDEPESFDETREKCLPFLKLHGLTNAKIAARESYPTAANWKLVMENFMECYHCLPSHPEYCSVNDNIKLVADGSEKAAGEYIAFWDEWNAEMEAKGLPVEAVSSRERDRLSNPDKIVALGEIRSEVRSAASVLGAPIYAAYRNPIKRGSVSLTEDGKPAAPLMGSFKEYDGGETIFSVGYLGTVSAANDYAAVFRFTPVGPEMTDVEIIWLVRDDAEEGKDYDPERVKWMWHVTTVQDKKIVEDNQAGVNSRLYEPGPYSELEGETDRFVRWCLAQIRTCEKPSAARSA